MSNEAIIQADYEPLGKIANHCDDCAQHVQQLYSTVDEQVARLQNGEWISDAASTFYASMNQDLMPGLERLMRSFQDGSSTLNEIVRLFQQAEEEAADALLLNDNGASGGGGATLWNTQDGQGGVNDGIDRSKNTDGDITINGFTPATGSLYLSDGNDLAGGDGLHPSDADQNQLGNCYFVSALAAFANNNPDAIRNAIQDNGDGTYTVTFHQKTWWGPFHTGWETVEYTVTPQIPQTVDVDGNPINAYVGDAGNSGELWPLVLENAYALHIGDGDLTRGYLELNSGGRSSDVWEALTGTGSDNYGTPSDLSIERLDEMANDGYAITFSTFDEVDGRVRYESNTDGYRLVTNHSYYVSSVDTANGTVTLRNVWSWNGFQPITIPYDEFNENFDTIRVNSGGD